MEFTEPLLISMMLTTGSTIVGTKVGIYYVTNFTLEYSSPNNASNLNYYTESEETDSKKVWLPVAMVKQCKVTYGILLTCLLIDIIVF